MGEKMQVMIINVMGLIYIFGIIFLVMISDQEPNAIQILKNVPEFLTVSKPSETLNSVCEVQGLIFLN
jgi:hypothetical protein